MISREDFEKFCFALPHTTHVVQWGNASVFKIGGKIFAIYSRWDNLDKDIVSFKASDDSFRILPEQPGIAPAKYLARAKWVQVNEEAGWDEATFHAYIQNAYNLILAKLPKKIRENL
ncbi:MmcQ/YjbR family DNA-binding protein [Maritalea sp. S77]|uniref:MmcQ/YjbR family DNA-binding protein n=1 Tax=Maritalea sp. S77 TaxID=3415125 RepID=UPI003C7D530A